MERPFSNPLVKGIVLFLVALAGINLLYAVIGFYAIPAVLKAQVPKQLSPLLKRTVTVGPVEFNPYSLKLLIKDFKVASPESGETLASVEALTLDIEGQSIIRQSLVLKEAEIAGPTVNVIMNADNTFNFTDILNNEESKQENLPRNSTDSEKNKYDFIFILKHIAIKNGKLNILDKKALSSHTITGFDLFVPSLSNYKNDIDDWIEPQIIANVNGGMLYCYARIKPFSPYVNTVIDTKLSRVDLLSYLSYLPPELKLQILSGELNADAHVEFARDEEGAETLNVSGNLALANLETKHADGTPLLRLKALEGALDQLDPIRRTVHVSNVTLRAPELNVTRKQGGRTSLESIYALEQARKDPVPPPPPPEPETGSFSLRVDEVSIEDGTVHFSDLAIPQPFETTLKGLGIKVLGWTNQDGARPTFTLTAETESREKLNVSGDFTLNPLTATGILETQAIQLPRYAPYFRNQIRFDLKEGSANLKTDYRFSLDGKEPDLQLQHLSLGLHGLRCAREGDPEDFLDLTSFAIRDSSFDLRRKELILKDIQAQDGRVFARRESDGSVNLLKLTAAGEAASETGGSALSGAALKKVETVAKIMYERPGLQIDLEGRADPARERDLLLKARLTEIVKAQKAKEPPKKEKESPPQVEGDIPPGEQEALLRKAFAEQIGNADLAKKLSLDVIKKQLLDKAPVGDDDVKAIASQRAASVRDQLVNVGKIDAKRIFLVEPKLDAGAGNNQEKPGVVMKLK